jgi:hypothetical protein
MIVYTRIYRTPPRPSCEQTCLLRARAIYISRHGSRRGGIGRRARLKIWYPQGCVGSTPSVGTIEINWIEMNSQPPESLTQAKFTESLNTRFSVSADSGEAIELHLVEVTAGPATASSDPGAGRYESFALLFHGPANRFLPQKTYSFDHPQIGKFALFIVPIGKEGDLFKYQAVFNRRVQPA